MIRAALIYNFLLPMIALTFVVWSALPVRVLELRSIDAPSAVRKGDIVWLQISYCKYMDVWPEAQPVALDAEGQIILVAPIPVPKSRHAALGCGVNWVPAFVLPATLPDSMHGHKVRARVSWIYHALGREVTASGWSTAFEVVP